MQLLVSSQVPEVLNASGVHPNGAGSNLSGVFIVNKQQFMHGDRSLMTVQTFDNQYTDQHTVLVKERMDFQKVESALAVGFMYNVHT